MADEQDWEAIKRERGLPFPPQGNRLFVDRIEDNGVAVLLGPGGMRINVPAKKGWHEGMLLSPSAGAPAPSPAPGARSKPAGGDAGGFYLTPPTGMDPTEGQTGPPEMGSLRLQPPTGMDPTEGMSAGRMTPPAPIGNDGSRAFDTGAGQYMDNHQPVPAAPLKAHERNFTEPAPGPMGFGAPNDLYSLTPGMMAERPGQGPTPFRLPGGDVGPSPPRRSAGGPEDILFYPGKNTIEAPPGPQAMMSMPSGRGRTRRRRSRPVP